MGKSSEACDGVGTGWSLWLLIWDLTVTSTPEAKPLQKSRQYLSSKIKRFERLGPGYALQGLPSTNLPYLRDVRVHVRSQLSDGYFWCSGRLCLHEVWISHSRTDKD